jgi:acyl carrier protein
MKKTEFLSHLAEMLDVDPSEVLLKSDLDMLGWDSLSSLAFIGFVDEHFAFQVLPKLLLECSKVSDLVKLCSKYLS